MIPNKILICMIMLGMLAGVAYGDLRDGTANLVLGQSNFTSSGASDAFMNGPRCVAVDPMHKRVFVADSGNHRVLWWNNYSSLGSGETPDGVLGQATPSGVADNRGGAVAANTLSLPSGLAVDASGNLWVADFGNHRVLRYRYHGESSPYEENADLVLGQASFTVNGSRAPAADSFRNPMKLSFDASGNLWVSDHNNHRVMRFAAPISNNEPADLVLGQSNLTSGAANGTGQEFALTAANLFLPNGVFADADGSVWVADCQNHRVLRFPAPLSDGREADVVLGAPNFSFPAEPGPAAGLTKCTYSVWSDGQGGLWVSDGSNHRVIQFKAPFRNGMSASKVIGQPNFDSGRVNRAGTTALPAPDSFNDPRFAMVDPSGSLWVADTGNNRVLRFNSVSVSAISPNSVVPTGVEHVTITGDNFTGVIEPRLRQAGERDVVGRNVIVENATTLTCDFDLSNAATGFWNVTVPPADANATLENGFNIHYASTAVRAIARGTTHRVGIETPRGVVFIDIPAGSFAEDCVLTMAEPASMPNVDPGEFMPSDVAVEITNDKQLPLLKTATLTFAYNGTYVTGLNRSRLVVTVHDRGVTRWLQANSVASADNNRVVAKVRSLSIFRVVQPVVGSDLDTAAVFPNPYRPGSGGPYDDSMMGRGIVFSGLTNRANIKIFTLTGEQVIEIRDESGTGSFLWDTENDNNEKVASGVYIYLITNPDNSSQKRKGKFAIIR